MLFCESAIHHHVFAGADYPLRHEILLFMILVLEVEFQKTDLCNVLCDRLCPVSAHQVALAKLSSGQLDGTLLAEAQHELHFLFRQQPVQQPEIRSIFRHICRFVQIPVISNHHDQLLQKRGLLRIIAMIVLRQKVIVIEQIVPVLFWDHDHVLLFVKLFT